MNKKQIIMQAVMASAVVAVVGVSGNVVIKSKALPVQARTVSVIVDEATELQPPENFQVLGGDETTTPRERARIEHGEPSATHEFELGDAIPMEESRTIAIKRLEDIYARLDEPEVPPHEREMLEIEKHDLLVRHFEPGVGEVEPLHGVEVNEYPTSEPSSAPVEEITHSGFDINNLFNKVWGLFQGLILAWVPYKFYKRKDE